MPTDPQKLAALDALKRQCVKCKHRWTQRIARPTRCPSCFIPIDAWEPTPRRMKAAAPEVSEVSRPASGDGEPDRGVA